jgi:hypothetical protein
LHEKYILTTAYHYLLLVLLVDTQLAFPAHAPSGKVVLPKNLHAENGYHCTRMQESNYCLEKIKHQQQERVLLRQANERGKPGSPWTQKAAPIVIVRG